MSNCDSSIKNSAVSCKNMFFSLVFQPEMLISNRNKVLYTQAGGFFMAQLHPQFRTPPSFDCCKLPRRRFNQNIPPSIVLLQQCHCRNRHRGRLQNVSPPSVLFESSQIFFTIHKRHRRKKMMDQNFEIRIL